MIFAVKMSASSAVSPDCIQGQSSARQLLSCQMLTLPLLSSCFTFYYFFSALFSVVLFQLQIYHCSSTLATLPQFPEIKHHKAWLTKPFHLQTFSTGSRLLGHTVLNWLIDWLNLRTFNIRSQSRIPYYLFFITHLKFCCKCWVGTW
jgi:hypothetical protein